MIPRDLERLRVAAAGAPVRGVRVTARRGVWAQSGPWHRFEDSVTIAGWVATLDEASLELMHGWLTVAVVLIDVEHVTDDVSLMELAGNPTLEEALALGARAAVA